MATSVLFVCSGNICRSPMAEYLARRRFVDHDIVFSSAGTMAIGDEPATPEAIGVMHDLGIDMTGHRATPLDEAAEPDLVLGMELHHLVAARRRFPDVAPGSIRLLAHPDAIADPYGRGVDAYQTALHQISTALDDAVLG